MDKRFEDFMRHSLFFGEAAAPAPNVYQTLDEVVVKPAVPSPKSECIGIDIIGNTLTIKREGKAKELHPNTIEIKAKEEK